MRRRLFLSSSSAAVGFALSACGGGGGGPTPSAALGSTSSSPASGSTNGSSPGTGTGTVDTTYPGGVSPQSASGYPFGSRKTAYTAGIQPSLATGTMDTMLATQYDAWKARRVVDASSVVPGGFAIQFSDTNFMTVSEGMGYGMLVAVVFAGHDPSAQQLFDGLLAVARTRYAYAVVPFDPNGKYLMEWRLNADGSSSGQGWGGCDGDLDIALALLMADRQWGSTGKWNYLQEGKNTIAALKSWYMKPDGTTKGLSTANVSRTSDYMFGHFRAFAAVTGDSFWNTAIDRAYWLSNLMQTAFSPGVGLMPDFIVATDTANPYPSPGYMGDGNANENKYWWNACRNPWRFSADYVLSGDARVKTVTQRLVDFFLHSSGGDPIAIGTGYNLDGTMVTGGQSPAYHGPICAGACIDAQYQSFADTMWNWNARNLTTGYYDGEIQLLSLTVASGNWWSPV